MKAILHYLYHHRAAIAVVETACRSSSYRQYVEAIAVVTVAFVFAAVADSAALYSFVVTNLQAPYDSAAHAFDGSRVASPAYGLVM